jgi:Putative prokaryotic signal transducing protein
MTRRREVRKGSCGKVSPFWAPGESMKMSEIEDHERVGAFVTLAHFAKSIEAEMARELLANNGVDAVLQGAYFGGLAPQLSPGGFSEIQLLVPEDEFERARQLYEAFFESDRQALDEDEEIEEIEDV